jgi:HlyD family secretion protein
VRIFVAVLVAVLIVGGLATAVGLRMRNGNTQAAATAVRVEPVARGDLVEVVSAPGQILPKDKVSISARVAARIVELPYEEGATVTKGDPTADPPVPASVLVRLDSRDLEAQLRAAEARYKAQEAQLTTSEARLSVQEARVTSARVTLADAERDLRRQRELLASRDVSQATVDQAQAKVDQLRADLDAATRQLAADRSSLVVLGHELDAADAEIARARDTLSYTTITSPIDGVVTKLNAKVGELVMTGTMNNAGTVIMEVADLSTMLVNAKVDESSIAGVEVGQRAQVRAQAYGDEVFEGVVRNIALAHTEEKDLSKHYKTEVLLQTNGRRIYSGLTAEVEIETRRHTGVLKVPGQAVQGRPLDDVPQALRGLPEVDGDKSLTFVVFRAVGDKAALTPVRVGPSDMTHTIIESGLSEGDRVIVGPYKVLDALKHDQPVKDEAATTQPTTRAAKN